MSAREELTAIFKRNRRLAELNPDLCAEVLAGKNSGIKGAVARQKLGQGKATNEQSAPVTGSVGLKEQGQKRKYGNEPVMVGNIRFDSKKEARRFGELQLLEKAGEIKGLKRQVEFQLGVNGMVICKYVCDFVYLEKVPWQERGYEDRSPQKWRQVVEDVKSVATKTRVYAIKKKLMQAVYGIAIRET